MIDPFLCRLTIRRLLQAAACLLTTVLIARTALTCAPAPPPGKSVSIANESALIIWDSTNTTEHFIRRALFTTDADDFGFLVPTPYPPTLTEVEDDLFTTLEQITAPEIKTVALPRGGGCGCGMKEAPAPKAEAVHVIAEQRVAGHDAAVLEAENPDALINWLSEHGYETSPLLTNWLKPYLDQHWKITAFRIAKDAPESEQVATKAICMSFHTDKPFYPYREPASGPPADDAAGQHSDEETPRMLRVYFVGTERVDGALGLEGTLHPGKVVWSNRLDAPQRLKIANRLSVEDSLPEQDWWLTEFEDDSSPRPGTDDVFYARSDKQTPLVREPVTHYVSTGDYGPSALIVIAACLAITRSFRRRLS